MSVVLDPAPLWLPVDEETTDRQIAVGPPVRVEGWTWGSLFLANVVGDRAKTVSRTGLLVGLAVALITWPSLAAGNVFELIRLAVWQCVAIGVLLAITRPVRSISLGTTVVHWLAGFFLAPLVVAVVDVAAVAMPGLEGRPLDVIRPVVAVLAQAGIVCAGALIARRRWQQPGITDLLVAGFAVGSGFVTQQDGVWDLALGTSLLTGSPATWTALVGASIGAVLLHRGDTVVAVAAAGVTALVIGDQTLLDLRWLPTCLLMLAVVAGMHLDRQLLETVARRDHLFHDVDERRHDVLVGRYRRLRHGVHMRIADHGAHWPPLEGAPVAELAHAARHAGVEVGTDTSREGWDRNPDDRSGETQRYFGRNGWTTFVVSPDGTRREPTRARPDAPLDDVPATAPRWRSEKRLWWIAGACVVLAAIVALTASTALLGGPTLANAPSDIPIIRTAIGAIGAAAALAGTRRPTIRSPWELGPPEGTEV